MKKILTMLSLVLVLLVGCNPKEPELVHYYDLFLTDVSVGAYNQLIADNFVRSTVYSGSRAQQMLNIIANNPTANPDFIYHERRTIEQTLTWLSSFNLPSALGSLAKDSMTAYYYIGQDNYYYAVFVEDVTNNRARHGLNSYLGNLVISQNETMQLTKIAQ
ncbi:MAG: hypothetical protein FWE37_05720 [Spirochaetaceae bacterium]|nr:hypothetical protein [Spirochaetaceae bacterium]